MLLYHSYLAILKQVTSHPVTVLGHLQYLHLDLCGCVRVSSEMYSLHCILCILMIPLDTIDSDHTQTQTHTKSVLIASSRSKLGPQ